MAPGPNARLFGRSEPDSGSLKMPVHQRQPVISITLSLEQLQWDCALKLTVKWFCTRWTRQFPSYYSYFTISPLELQLRSSTLLESIGTTILRRRLDFGNETFDVGHPDFPWAFWTRCHISKASHQEPGGWEHNSCESGLLTLIHSRACT